MTEATQVREMTARTRKRYKIERSHSRVNSSIMRKSEKRVHVPESEWRESSPHDIDRIKLVRDESLYVHDRWDKSNSGLDDKE